MLNAAKVFTIISGIRNFLTIFVAFYKDGPLIGFIMLIIEIISIFCNIYCLSEMNAKQHNGAVIPLSFIFGDIFSGIFYSCWYASTYNEKKEFPVSVEANSIHWRCSNCGKEVTFVNHCICGHDYDSSIDEQIASVIKEKKKKEFVFCSECGASNAPYASSCVSCGSPIRKQTHFEKKKCPHCEALVNVDDISCFNCGQNL